MKLNDQEIYLLHAIIISLFWIIVGSLSLWIDNLSFQIQSYFIPFAMISFWFWNFFLDPL